MRCSLAVSRPTDPRVVRVIDGPELETVDQRSHAVFAELFAQIHPVVAFVSSEAGEVARIAVGDLPAEVCVVVTIRTRSSRICQA